MRAERWMDYFSDREHGPKPRTGEALTPTAWAGLVSRISGWAAQGWFGIDYPAECPDGGAVCGTHEHRLMLGIAAEIPDFHAHWTAAKSRPRMSWNPGGQAPQTGEFEVPRDLSQFIDSQRPPELVVAMDLVEFFHRHVALPSATGHHSYFRHDHLVFDRASGRHQYREAVNLIFRRNGLAFHMNDSGQVRRVAAPPLNAALADPPLRTGDYELDRLLSTAVEKFRSPDPSVRQEALERLWDAWERAKDISIPGNKAAATKALLDKAAQEPSLRAFIEEDARQLTSAGNNFFIRHSEIRQVRVSNPLQQEYLFHRLFAMVWLVLRSR